MDPDFSDEHRRFIAERAEVLTEGYTTTATPATHHWVCQTCMDDFADEYGWNLAAR